MINAANHLPRSTCSSRWFKGPAAAAGLAVLGLQPASAAIPLVENGQPRAVVVIADEATETARYAAEELVRHLQQATGAELETVVESAIPAASEYRVFVGITEAARAQGIEPETMEPDAFVLRAVGNDLYVLGKENPALDRLLDADINRSVLFAGNVSYVADQPRGTLFGVYELLGRYAGVRWLWPGELGTYVPAARRIAIEDAPDERHTPGIKSRHFRWEPVALDALAGVVPPPEPLNFSLDVLQQYHRDLAIYLARHKVNRSERRPITRHHFQSYVESEPRGSWWEQYGEEHPEWFALNEYGMRGPLPGAAPISPMCVSNPDLHRFLVEEHWPRLQARGWSDLPLGEVDIRGVCHCERCRSWDVTPESLPDFMQPVYARFGVVSNRYARFWNTIAQRVAEKNPDTLVTTFLYWNYFPAPEGDLELSPNIYGEFVPWDNFINFFPMTEEADQWVREQWLGWKRTGIRMGYRPNQFHRGYVMPDLSTHQAGEFFRFAYENGMVGFLFDTLYGHWSTRGPMLYMYMRLSWRPDLDIAAVLDEYYSAFGPAAPHVRAYFEYWEERCLEEWIYNVALSHEFYPPASFDPAAALLDRAREAVFDDPNPEFVRRVDFLRAGLEHARLATRFTATLDQGRAPAPGTDAFKASQTALRQLIRFRRATERMYISDLHDASRKERRYISFGELLD